jgi:hypothetical protein
MLLHILLPLLSLALIAGCVALLRSSSKQRRVLQAPSDLRRADDAAGPDSFDAEKAYRAAQDTFDQILP